MVDRGADPRQPERDVDRMAEACVLEHRQALVVVHREHRVVAREARGHECGVRRERPFDVVTGGAQLCDRGRDLVDFLAPEVAAFTRMRVESEHRHARSRDAESADEFGKEDREAARDACARDRRGYRGQGEVGGRERHTQRTCVAFARRRDQHHHDVPGSACREELGVAGERDARVVDDALVQRRGHDRVELAIAGPVGGTREHLDDPARVARIELTRRHALRQRKRQHAQLARGTRRHVFIRVVRTQPQRNARGARRVLEQGRIDERDQIGLDRGRGEPCKQLRADARGLARGQREARQRSRRRVRHGDSGSRRRMPASCAVRGPRGLRARRRPWTRCLPRQAGGSRRRPRCASGAGSSRTRPRPCAGTGCCALPRAASRRPCRCCAPRRA